jgi:ribonuclease HII
MNKLYKFDKNIRVEYPILCGVDEAGRGPLCGPVCCAAVVLDPNFLEDAINDSKKLKEKDREKLFDIILKNAISYSIQFINEDLIDDINILNATMLGMEMAVKSLDITPDIVIIDGNRVPRNLNVPKKAIIKGDSISMSIAAASILAKVSRDRYMVNLSKEYPQYLLEKHKGYPTKQHYELLRKFGVPYFYRKSFLKNKPELKWINE